MSSRSYDYILSVVSAAPFRKGNTIIGVSSLAFAEIIAVDSTNNTLKVKLANSQQEFGTNEQILSNSTSNLVQATTASTFVNGTITPSPYIREKNAFIIDPEVVLYSIYYPGEWYPPNANGNPSSTGAGYPWPYGFPLRYAAIVGDESLAPQYISFNSESYRAFPVNSSPIKIGSAADSIEIVMDISNYDNVIADLVENPNLVGNSAVRGARAIVNRELVYNIDPRTISSNAAYNAGVTTLLGANAALTYEAAIASSNTWSSIKFDSRDLLGAVVEIKRTYAKFLDYWPEYSTVNAVISNDTILVVNPEEYSVGDIVKIGSNANVRVISNIRGSTITLNSNLSAMAVSSNVLIVNSTADGYCYTTDVFKIAELSALTDVSAAFAITSRVQYQDSVTPKRKYTKNSCPFVYKGALCQYPSSGSGFIANTSNTLTANGMFTVNNVSTVDATQDECAHSLKACTLRNNIRHFGGFPGVGNV